MRGVCVDALNPKGRPSPLRLERLYGKIAVRMEMRDHTDFYDYYYSLYGAGIQVALLVGPSTENVGKIVRALGQHSPELLIIGNEPDGLGPSSWSMTPVQYQELWNQAAWAASIWSDTPLSTAGMLYGPDFLEKCSLHPEPNYVNVHYPSGSGAITAFGKPAIVGEWCWRTGKAKQIKDWQAMLNQYTAHSFWFCWSDGMVPNMGLYDSRDVSKHACYTRYKKALAS